MNSFDTVRWAGVVGAVVLSVAFTGCGGAEFADQPSDAAPAADEPVGTIGQPLATLTLEDHSVPSVHIQVKVCGGGVPAQSQNIDCKVDAGYAVFGGGAFAQYTGPGALLTESAPLSDGRTWRGKSKSHVYSDSHSSTVYAIGVRFDGVAASTLRSMILRSGSISPSSPPGVSAPSGTDLLQPMTLGGGVEALTSGPGQLVTSAFFSGNTWRVSSKDHLVSSLGRILATELALNSQGIIEGFGALEIQRKTGNVDTVSTGLGGSFGTVTPGWALVSLGGRAVTTSGPGRMLFRIGTGNTARDVAVQSKDHGVVSAGTTTASWTEVRKTTASHGLCSEGSRLAVGMDPCAASICGADPFCCSSAWDGLCVNEVASICGRTCGADTCSVPSFSPTSVWVTDPYTVTNNNCYSYALNTVTNRFAQPGYAQGDDGWCKSRSDPCNTADGYAKFAATDGLIPTTSPSCSDNRTLVALFVAPNGGGFHWLRRDADGTWSQKLDSHPATNTDSMGNRLTDPMQAAAAAGFTEFGGYFCGCTSAADGQGHAVIQGPPF